MKEQQLFLLENSSLQGLIDELQTAVSRLKAGTYSPEVVGSYDSDSKKVFKCAVVAGDSGSLLKKLQKLGEALREGTTNNLTSKDDIYYFDQTGPVGKVAWLFPGFGSEFPHMLSGLQNQFPSVKKWLKLMAKLLGTNTTEVEDKWLQKELEQKKYGLHEIGPFGSITSLALQEVLKELNVPCDAMIGHSNGENSALIASGILGYENDEQLLQIIGAATSLPKPEQENGQYLMLSRIAEPDLQTLLQQFQGDAILAMKNCPGQTVLYVNKRNKNAVLQVLKKLRVVAFDLYTDHPYHTAEFVERAQMLRPVYHRFQVETGKELVYSCVDGEPFPRQVKAIRTKALEQWISPVLFEKTILNCYDQGFDTFIEIGPGNKLQGFVKDILRGKKHTALSCSQQHVSAWDAFLELVINLWGRQIPVNIEKLLVSTSSNKKALAPRQTSSANKAIFLAHQELMQQFLQSSERITSAYLAGRKTPKKTSVKTLGQTPLLNGQIKQTRTGFEIETRLDQHEFPLVNDHSMGSVLPVIPFTLSMELLAEAASLLPGFNQARLKLTEVKGNSWLMYEQDILELKITVEQEATGARVKVFHQDESKELVQPAFEGFVTTMLSQTRGKAEVTIGNERRSPSISVDTFYKDHLFHGPCFQSLAKIEFWNTEGAQAIFKMPTVEGAIRACSKPEFVIPGPMLDSCGQLMAYWLYEMGLRNYAIFPFSSSLFEQYQRFPASGEELICTANIQQKFGFVSGSFDFTLPSGECIGRLEGFQLKMYQNEWIPPLLMNRLEDAGLREPDQSFLEEGAGIWKKILAKMLLTEDEYALWLSHDNSRQTEHLLELLALKEPQIH